MSWADLGSAALRAALPVAIWGCGAAAYAAAKRDGRGLASARWSSLLALVLVSLAVVGMEGSLLTHDFSVQYVAQNNARETPTFFTVISLWAALEGSILLWTLVLTGATAYVAWRGTRELPRLATAALAVLLAMLAFFLLLVTTPAADPFVRIDPPFDGNGPNPLLQNHPLMALHPPLLYLGYVLFSVPFAYAIASLVLGEGGDRWLVATRRFALVSWALLGVGIVAGSWWSYAVLGWGGYWAWDPVENAAIMPWLTATAYLHSVMVEEKRRLLRTWNLSLVITTFALTILGTFLTRSGVVNSVHAFTQSAIGPLLLGYLVAIVVLSVGLLLWRMPRLAESGGVGAPLSREAIFLFQNVVFVAATLTVLLGTLYPLIAEAVSGAQLSIGRPYFDRVEVPLALALLFLMGIGPQLPWHGASRATLERQFTAPVVAGACGAVLAVVLGIGGAFAVLTYALAAFVAATVVQEFARGVHARGVLHGEGPAEALANLLRRSGRRYGGYIVHLGIVVIAVAVATSQAGTVQVEKTLAPGDTVAAGPYLVRLVALRDAAEPQRDLLVADLAISGNGADTRLSPALVFYPNSTQAVGSPGIAAGPRDDLYTILAAYDNRAKAWATIRVLVIPLVSWLWVGGLIVGLGAVVAALPQPRRGIATRRAVEVPVAVET
ncbi:MAG TPA: cytochrome c-type biogenesis CcmF C-terminal domain-containing protein [Candidatus Limnocylindria bacterium]|nr:cytochrome c-type biogenesis CcmF C-terminal domain-containing protein [Candidatus Limnocylindria bacterium]